eukprot:scaffold25262_cov118-Isochrysis_galbana.AAC.4
MKLVFVRPSPRPSDGSLALSSLGWPRELQHGRAVASASADIAAGALILGTRRPLSPTAGRCRTVCSDQDAEPLNRMQPPPVGRSGQFFGSYARQDLAGAHSRRGDRSASVHHAGGGEPAVCNPCGGRD